jgi:uncharacterized membrane protein YkvA (DUF1232 family)
MTDQRTDFYQDLRKRIRRWAATKEGKAHRWVEILLTAPDLFHLLCKLTVDPEVPVSEKAKLAAAIAYFISPLDLVPEALVGPGGYVDDVALAAYVLNSIVNKTGPEVLKRHWAGEEDVLTVVQKILKVADRMVGSGLWDKLRRIF